MGLNGLTVSIVAVVVYLLALLRLGVSIRLLHPEEKNPPPLPPMVIQNVEEDMGGEHTTERTEFMQANSRSTNSSSVAAWAVSLIFHFSPLHRKVFKAVSRFFLQSVTKLNFLLLYLIFG